PTASRPKTPPEGGGIGARIKEANRENANETMNSSSVATMLPILRTGASRHIMVGFGPAACYPESHSGSDTSISRGNERSPCVPFPGLQVISMNPRIFVLPLMLVLALASRPRAAEPVKPLPPLKMADILAWKSIRGTALSQDGQWFAYQVTP